MTYKTASNPVYYLDREGSILCEECAEESREDWIPQFRIASGPHPTGIIDEFCDQCSAWIPPSDTEEAPCE